MYCCNSIRGSFVTPPCSRHRSPALRPSSSQTITCQAKATIDDIDGLAETVYRDLGETWDHENRVFNARSKCCYFRVRKRTVAEYYHPRPNWLRCGNSVVNFLMRWPHGGEYRGPMRRPRPSLRATTYRGYHPIGNTQE